MKGGLIIRLVLALGLAAFALGLTAGPSPDGPSPAGPYSGPMQSVHAAAIAMSEPDRYVMSQAFTTGSKMLAADKKDLVSTTEHAQDFVFGILSFSYNGVGQPVNKYPTVADAIEAELRKVYGDDIKNLSSSEKQEIVNCLAEIGRAVR